MNDVKYSSDTFAVVILLRVPIDDRTFTITTKMNEIKLMVGINRTRIFLYVVTHVVSDWDERVVGEADDPFEFCSVVSFSCCVML